MYKTGNTQLEKIHKLGYCELQNEVPTLSFDKPQLTSKVLTNTSSDSLASFNYLYAVPAWAPWTLGDKKIPRRPVWQVSGFKGSTSRGLLELDMSRGPEDDQVHPR